MGLIIIFILGIIIGSFLNSVIWRIQHGKSIFRGRSQCVHCDRRLIWHDLVPFLSFAVQAGKCRYCRKKISWQYPLVELVTGFLFIIIYWNNWNNWGNWPSWSYQSYLQLLFYFLVTSILIILFVSDLRYMTLPVGIILGTVGISFLVQLFLGVSWYNLLLAGAVGFAFFALQYFISKGRWIGDGDMYLGALMGLVLGWPRVLYAILAAYILGAIVALILLVSGRAKWGSKIPLGVFLTIATFVVMVFGDQIYKLIH